MDWVLYRKATYTGSTVTFDKPVQEYSPATYTRMHSIRFKGIVYLIASDRIRNFEEDTNDSDTYEMWLLKKRPAEEIDVAQ